MAGVAHNVLLTAAAACSEGGATIRAQFVRTIQERLRCVAFRTKILLITTVQHCNCAQTREVGGFGVTTAVTRAGEVTIAAMAFHYFLALFK
jgi:hypothetical protein